MNILLGITGSVGAQLTEKLVNKFVSQGHVVRVVATENAKKFIPYPSKFYNECITQEMEFDRYRLDKSVLHIEYAQWADVYVICPCTANTLGKIQHGICDNLVLSTLKAFDTGKKKLFIAPVMNTNMLRNSIHLINPLKHSAHILWPTVKRLACGDFGLGAYPHIDDIVNIVSGHKWNVPRTFSTPGILNNCYTWNSLLCQLDHPGWFGAQRKHDIHTGIDLYCAPNTNVSAFEDGEIINKGYFTGPKADCSWWNESKYLSIKGKSGVIIYGEIETKQGLHIGDSVKSGDLIGNVVRILKKQPTKHVLGHSMDMLHIELLSSETERYSGNWSLDMDRPKHLKDPTIYLYQ